MGLLRKLIYLPTLLFSLGFSQVDGDSFDGEKNNKFMLKRDFIKYENNIFLKIDYDIKPKNGISDTYAIFPIISVKENDMLVGKYAIALYKDLNEDGKIDKVYLDTDFNGTLETILNGKGEPLKGV